MIDRVLTVFAWCSVVLTVLVCPDHGWAQAFRYQPQSATGAGQANAFAAQADDPSALHYNAAGMTQLGGVQWSGTTQLLGASVDFRNSAGATAHGDAGSIIAMPLPTQLYLTGRLKDLGLGQLGDISVGIGLTTPYALKSRYPDAGPFSTAVTSSAIPLVDIKPTLAYRFNKKLAVGVGADIYTFGSFIGDGQVEQKLVWPGGGGIPAGANVELNGKGTTAGFNVSLLYSPLLNEDGLPIANIGLVYRGQATLDLNGSLLVNGSLVSDATSTLVLPATYTAAAAIWPIRNRDREWKVEVDIDYVDWKSVRNLDVRLTGGGTIPQPLNWRTVPTVSFGTEYRILQMASLPHWTMAFRGGYTYSLSQVPDRTFNPGIPSFNSHTVATGIGLTCYHGGSFLGVLPCGRSAESGWYPKGIGLDLAFQAWIYENRTVQGNQNPTVDGRYTTQLYLGALSLRLIF